MPKLVVAGAQMSCSMGSTPSVLSTIPTGPPVTAGAGAGTIQDFKPMANVPMFGPCKSLSFPATASATSAAMGALTPMPCVPLITAPWSPGASKVMVNNQPALTDSSTCMCNWGGTITISNAGQAKVDVT